MYPNPTDNPTTASATAARAVDAFWTPENEYHATLQDIAGRVIPENATASELRSLLLVVKTQAQSALDYADGYDAARELDVPDDFMEGLGDETFAEVA